MSALEAIDFDGMSFAEAAWTIGRPEPAAKMWLFHRGYRIPDRIVRRVPSVEQREAQFAELRLRHDRPCFRCGAARGCEHR